MVPFPMTLNEP